MIQFKSYFIKISDMINNNENEIKIKQYLNAFHLKQCEIMLEWFRFKYYPSSFISMMIKMILIYSNNKEIDQRFRCKGLATNVLESSSKSDSLFNDGSKWMANCYITVDENTSMKVDVPDGGIKYFILKQ